MTKKLDLLDKKILYELETNSRASTKDIGRKVRASKETVHYRINRMVKKGYVNLFYTLLDVNKLGFTYYKIYLKLHRTDNTTEKEIMDYIRSTRNCTNLRLHEGRHDIDFLFLSKTVWEVSAFLRDLKRRFGEHIYEKDIHIVEKMFKMNQRILAERRYDRKGFEAEGNVQVDVDGKDKRILDAISKDSRAKLVDMSDSIGLSPKVIAYRIRKMEKNGVIMGYTVKVNYEKLGLQSYQMNISLRDMESVYKITAFFEATGHSVFAYEMLGKYDVAIELHVPDSKRLREVVNRFKGRFKRVYNYFDVSNIFREYVIDWSPFKKG